MWRSWKLGSAFGIGVYVHWSFLLVPLFAFLSQVQLGTVGQGAFVAALVFCMFGCILLHEFGHALMARVFGIGTRDITLYPIGGVARLDRLSERPREELLIALAGPAVNCVIAGFLAAVVAVGYAFDPGFITGTLIGEFLFMLAVMNVGIVAFNLIPAFPMDGGRVLRALLTRPLGHLPATRVAAWIGGVLALALAFVGIVIFQHPFVPVVAVFLFIAGQQELSFLEWKKRRERRMAAEAAACSSDPVLPAVRTYLWNAETGEWVAQPNSPFYRSL